MVLNIYFVSISSIKAWSVNKYCCYTFKVNFQYHISIVKAYEVVSEVFEINVLNMNRH